MTLSFEEVATFIAEKLGTTTISQEILERGTLVFIINGLPITINQERGKISFMHHLAECRNITTIHLERLLTGNFLGIKTGGATLALSKEKQLYLRLTCMTELSKSDYWSYFEHFFQYLCYWREVLETWPECSLTLEKRSVSL